MKNLTKLRFSLVVVFLLFSSLLQAQSISLDGERVWVYPAAGKAQAVKQALVAQDAKIHYYFKNLNAYAVTLPARAVSALSKNKNVMLVEPDAKRYPMAQSVPYGIDKVQARDIWDQDRDGSVDANVPTGAGRLVCIIDSGLHTAHEDFAGVNVVGGYPSGWDSDSCGHGTHVAGTIAAANNSTGVVGVTPGSTSLYIVKVFDGEACGWSYSSDLVNAAQHCETAGANIISMSLGGDRASRAERTAFDNLYSNGILSIAAAGNDGNTRKSYPASYAGVVSIAAVDSANQVATFSQQNSEVELAAPGVSVLSTVPWLATNNITVNSTTYEGGHIEFAATGTVNGTLVDGGLCDSSGSWSGQVVLCERGVISFFDKVMNVQNSGAAGAVIYNNEPGGFAGTLGAGNSSTIPAISLSQEDGQVLISTGLGSNGDLVSLLSKPDSGYEAWNGTSMATPHVSGVAALVWSADPTLTNVDIRTALQSTALDLGDPGRDSAYGFGLVQARDAWLASSGGSTPTNQPPVASFSYNCTALSCSFDASGSSDPDGSVVSYAWNLGDNSSASGVSINHSYAASGSYNVTLTVTDDKGATSVTSQTVDVSDGGSTTGPVISNVSAASTGGPSFAISWTTDVPANSEVTFSCCGTYTDATLVTSHSMGFRGSKGATYEYFVSSTDAQGRKTTEGPFTYQN